MDSDFGNQVTRVMRRLKLRRRLRDIIESDRELTGPFWFKKVETIPPQDMPQRPAFTEGF